MRLDTDRLEIRNFRADDWRDLHEYLSLPEIYLYEPGDPIDVRQAMDLAEARSKASTFLAVVLKTEGKMIGHLYFEQQEPEDFQTWELGYIFNPKYQNRGCCTEASKKLIEYAFRDLKAHKVVAFCDPENPASWRVLEKIGMRREGLFAAKAFFRKDDAGNPLWHDCLAFGMLDKDLL